MSPSLCMSFWWVTLSKDLKKLLYKAKISPHSLLSMRWKVSSRKTTSCETTDRACRKPYCSSLSWRSIRGYILAKRIFSKTLNTFLSKLIGLCFDMSAQLFSLYTGVISEILQLEIYLCLGRFGRLV